MNILHVDAHASLCLDLADIFARLGHRTHSWCVSRAAWFARGAQDPAVSALLQSRIDEDACDRFHRAFAGALECFDVIVVDHPVSYAALFARLGRPVVAMATTRYDLGAVEDPPVWAWLDRTIAEMFDRGQLIPLSNNRGDRAYGRHRFGFDWPTIPSLCEYCRIDYTGEHGRWLRTTLAEPPLPQPYAWSDLGRFRGIGHVPYNCSQMSVFEQYSAAIPLAFPTPERLLALAVSGEMGAMTQVSSLRVAGRPPGADWNAYDDRRTLAQWVEVCDWYDDEWMPAIVQLDDVGDQGRLAAVDARSVSRRMADDQPRRRREILARWRRVLDGAGDRGHASTGASASVSSNGRSSDTIEVNGRNTR